MKDIEDLRMYEILCRFWKHLKIRHLLYVGYWGFRDIWTCVDFEIIWIFRAPRMLDIEDIRIYIILSTFGVRNFETPHSQDHGFWGFKDIWVLAMIWRISENMTPPGWRILRIWGYCDDYEIFWKHHTCRMKDI